MQRIKPEFFVFSPYTPYLTLKKKLLIIAMIIFASTAGYAQKIEIDKETGVISADGTDYAILLKENAPGQLGINKNFTIANLEGEELLYFVFTQEPELNDLGYETGKTLTFYTLNFIQSGKQGQRSGTMRAIGAAKLACFFRSSTILYTFKDSTGI